MSAEQALQAHLHDALAAVSELQQSQTTRTKRKPKHSNLEQTSRKKPRNTSLDKKWITTAEMEESGKVTKKGKFTDSENNIIKAAVSKYLSENQIDTDEFTEMLFSSERRRGADGRMASFWPELSSQLPDRPLPSIYHHVRRMYHPDNYAGKWSTEDDSTLKELVKLHGRKWNAIGAEMGRMPMSCRDRFRDIEKAVNSGRWTPEEEALLLSTVKELQRGKSTDSDIKWSVVAQRVRTRNSHQCRIKWYDCLNVKEKVQDKRRKWNALDERYLLKRLYDSGVEEESAIHWNTLLDSDWNLWSADKLRRKWAKMKHRIPNVASKSFEEILESLMKENDNIDVSKLANYYIEDSDDENDPYLTVAIPPLPNMKANSDSATSSLLPSGPHSPTNGGTHRELEQYILSDIPPLNSDDFEMLSEVFSRS